MALAFLASGALGMLVEWALIRHLYKRPLDTLLATWGLSLILQQTYRSVFGPREVGVELPQWMLGSLKVTDSIEVPINGIFVMGLTLLITVAVAYVMYKSRWGRQVRAVVQNRIMAGAVGINTEKVDRYTFGLGCGIAGVAGSAFTMIGSTGPTYWPALHRRYLPGGHVRRRCQPAWHHRFRLLDLADPVDARNSSCRARWPRCSRCLLWSES